jgi:bacterioferritin-associated ferredoxin
MIVCICHRVSDRDIARAAQDGCTSFDELQLELSVATSCGRCHDCARETFHRHATHAGHAPSGLDCDAQKHGKVIPIAAQAHHGPMASAAA